MASTLDYVDVTWSHLSSQNLVLSEVWCQWKMRYQEDEMTLMYVQPQFIKGLAENFLCSTLYPMVN